MNDLITKRLVFISYLFRVGVEQSHQAEPMNSISLLSFHDAVELFLRLTAEHFDVAKPDQKFMSYWDVIKPQPDQLLSQRESMRRMNIARVQLKHHGILPSKMDIESFRVSTENFFIENTPLVFKIEFRSISLLDLIHQQNVKSKLFTAQDFMKNNQIKDALTEIAWAFRYMIDEYQKNKWKHRQNSPFFFGGDFAFQNSFFMRQDGKMGGFIDKVIEALVPTRDAVRILCLGLDYKKYTKFKMITPYVTRGAGGYIMQKAEDCEIEDCEFCFNYVVESAIRLQDFDYDMAPYQTKI